MISSDGGTHSEPFLTTIDIDLEMGGVSPGEEKLIGVCQGIGSRKTTGVSFGCKVNLGIGTGIGSEAGRISTRGFWLAASLAGRLVDARIGRVACCPVEV